MNLNYAYLVDDVRTAIVEFRALGLNGAAINRLLGQNIRSLKDLSRLTKADLRRIPGIGELTIKQLRLYLHPDASADDPERDAFVATMILAPSLVEAVDSWVEQNFEGVSRADAIHTLIQLGLQAQSPIGEP